MNRNIRSIVTNLSRCYQVSSQIRISGFIFNHKFSPCRLIHTNTPWFAERAIVVPPFAESVTEGDIVWKAAVGDFVKTDDVVAEVETDKTNVPIPAPCNGVITSLLVDDGSRVVPALEVCKLDDSAEPPAGSEPAKSEAPASPPPSTSKPTSEDQQPSQAKPQPSSPPTSPPSVSSSGSRGEQRVKMNRMRLRIAQRLKDAQNTCAMLTTFNEIDLSNLMELRSKYQDTFVKKHGIKLGMMSTFVKASALALKDQPAVNAVIDGTDIIYRDYVDISIAVAAPKGLLVPVLRNVEAMNYLDIEREIASFGKKAREGAITVEEMDGGTFTITNGGVFGSLISTPIINPPQSAILGLHGIFDRPVAHKGQVVIRPMMYVALTYDHRLVDGREAVLFLRRVKDFVEDPRLYFLQM